MSIYKEHIMDHYHQPRNRGRLESPDVQYMDSNPTCGDEINVAFTIKDGTITHARHWTIGCAISQAGASMLFEQLEGKTPSQVLQIPKEAILEEFGTELSVSRVKCALLALSAVKKAFIEKDAQGPHAGKEYEDVRN